ncbi:hypothetical protein CPB84DRAFT_1018938 [Gymnopilus junonius]|uniref:Uncharacterized protein n=1 Tax=Gymnopilus junonius TaxID=109634 RepID=A0A9P5NMW2_GYMJU|nr:hypothetical protein CPB84DRAFT_1018938 [Gymnopilus junonius]
MVVVRDEHAPIDAAPRCGFVGSNNDHTCTPSGEISFLDPLVASNSLEHCLRLLKKIDRLDGMEIPRHDQDITIPPNRRPSCFELIVNRTIVEFELRAMRFGQKFRPTTSNPGPPLVRLSATIRAPSKLRVNIALNSMICHPDFTQHWQRSMRKPRNKSNYIC